MTESKLDWITEERYQVLKELNEGKKPLKNNEISTKTGLRRSSTSKILNRLREYGLVKKKNRYYSITEEGAEIVNYLHKIHDIFPGEKVEN